MESSGAGQKANDTRALRALAWAAAPICALAAANCALLSVKGWDGIAYYYMLYAVAFLLAFIPVSRGIVVLRAGAPNKSWAIFAIAIPVLLLLFSIVPLTADAS